MRALQVKRALRSLLAGAVAVLIAAAPLAAKDKKDKDKDAAPKPAAISARVIDAGKKPVPGAKVTIKGPTGEVAAEVVTDKKGEFKVEIKGEPGKYIVAIDAAGNAPFENPIDLEAGQEQRVEIKLLSAEEGKKNFAIKLYNEAADAFRKQDWPVAKAKFAEALVASPEMAEPRLGLADIALTEGNTQDAITQVEAYLKIKPDDVQGKKIAYTAYLRAGQQDKAKAISAELGDAKLNAGLAIDLYNQGALASQKNDFDTALAKFKEATDYDANLAEAWAGMGSVLYNQGKFAEALANAEKALALKPTLQPAMRSRFLALDGLKRKQEAGVAWDAYAAIDKNGALDLLIRSAEADFKDGNLEAAEASLLRVLGLNPDDAQAHLQIGLVYASTNPQKCKEHLQRFLKLAPSHPEAETAKDILAYLK